MAEALAGVLPIAVGILVVPLPIAAVIVLLFSPRAKADGLAFLGGWVLGLAAAGALTLLVVSAMTGVAMLDLPPGQPAVILAVFVVVCSLGVTAPVVYALAGGTRARETLTSWETWLVANNAVVVAVVLLVFGIWILAGSLAELIG